jgi:DNA-binding response OmpR family regulator
VAGAKILLIDDSATVRKVVETALVRAGYLIQVADSVAEGVEAARAQRFDLLLLDDPGQTLPESTRALRAEPSLRGVPVVVLANREERRWEEIRRHPSVSDLIAKPFDPEVLVAAVEGVLHRDDSFTHNDPREDLPSGPVFDIASSDVIEAADYDGELASAEMALRGLLGQIAADALANRYGADPQVMAQQVARNISAPDLARRVAEVVWERPALAQAASLDLVGDIAIVPPGELLRLLATREETGLLRIADGEQRAEITLRHGRVDFVLATGLPEEFRLGRFVLEAGFLTEEALYEVLRSRSAAGRRLGRQLVKMNLLREDDLRELLHRQSLEILYHLLRWTRGRFVFDRARPASDLAREAYLGLDVEAVLLEGVRRVEEWFLIERRVPHFDLVFTRNEDALSEPVLANLTRDEAEILDLVNGKATVKEILQRSRRQRYDVARLLYRLAEARFIRPRVAPIAIG